MKKEINKTPESELIEKYPIRRKAEVWFFRVAETSNNSWEVEGINHWGRKVYSQGDDPEVLLSEADLEAICINRESNAT